MLHSLTPLSEEEEDWQLAKTFHSIFLTLYIQKRKRRKPALRFWLLISYHIVISERHALKTSTLAPTTLFCKGLHPVSPSPSSTCTLTRTHFWHFSVPVFVFITDRRMHPASLSTRFLKQCRGRLIFQNAFHLHSGLKKTGKEILREGERNYLYPTATVVGRVFQPLEVPRELWTHLLTSKQGNSFSMTSPSHSLLTENSPFPELDRVRMFECQRSYTIVSPTSIRIFRQSVADLLHLI